VTGYLVRDTHQEEKRS